MSMMHAEGSKGPATQVQLTISCRGLPNRDVGSKSDPLLVLWVSESGKGGPWAEEGRSERLDNTLDPDWATNFTLDYFFEQQQYLRFDVYDMDGDAAALSEHDFLGRAELSLGNIVGAGAGRAQATLTGSKKKGCGTIIISAEEVGGIKEVADFVFGAKKLDNKDWMGKSDPFLSVYRINDDQSKTLLHRSEVVKNNLSPSWKKFKIPVHSLTQGFNSRTLLLEVWDFDEDGGHDLIGEAKATFAQLSAARSSALSLEIVNPKKASKKKGYKNSGLLFLSSFGVHTEYSFLDYIRGGTQLHFTVAVDFTASNGNPTQPTSLHYIHPHEPNQYMRALKAVGDIISDYDVDRMFPALGFGGRLPDGTVSHEFFLNFHPTDPHCRGVEGVLSAYKQSLMSVQLYGPTNFAPVVNHVAKFAAATATHGTHYFVLLILTDGSITDTDRTVNAIVQASSLPMSIIIVGVGSDDFEAMEALDADKGRLTAPNGRAAERDIVQFVRFAAYEGSAAPGPNGGPSQAELGQTRLAKDVLKEIPAQLTTFMNERGIKPIIPAPVLNGSGDAIGQQPSFNPAFK